MLSPNMFSPFVLREIELIRLRAVFYDARVRIEIVLQMFPSTISNIHIYLGRNLRPEFLILDFA